MTRKEMITMKFKRLVTALLSATLMISLAACSGNEKPAESQTGEGTTAEAIHVNLAESWGFEYFYTIITPDVSSSTGYDITYYLTSFYDTLVTYNENNELVGSLAEDWSMSDDGKVYTFHIKEGIKFSDGSDLTAEDVAKSLMAVPVNLGQYTRLCECGFLIRDNDKYIHLTEKGKEIAEMIYERHRFFTERLIEAGVDPKTAEKDACRLEHAISNESFQKLKGSLKK